MEFDESEIKLADVVAALKRRAKLLIATAAVVFFIGAALAVLLPSIYRSEAIILIEKQEIPTDLVRSTVTSFADQRIQVISQRVMSSSNLMRIIDEYELYVDEKLREPREEILDRMRSDISLEMISADVVDPKSGRPTETNIAFSLSFENPSAQKSQRVVNELVTLFLNENIRSRADSAAETTTFLNDEAESLRARVAELEKLIADFKDKHANSRPELEGLTRDLMNRTELHLSEVERRIHETVQQKIYLEAELVQHEPVLPDAGPRGTSALEQLRTAEAQLSAAEASYGEAHPDVIRLRKQAEALRLTVEPLAARALYEEQLASLRMKHNSLLERYDDQHPDTVKIGRQIDNLQRKLDGIGPDVAETPNNPAYVALAARLDASRAQLASLEIKRNELTAKLDGYSNSLMLIPDAEAEYRALSRDYENALAKYREISSKQMEAKLSENLESERKGEKFTLIEPPLLPEQPAKPNRPAILLIAFVLSIISSLGIVRLIEMMDDRIRGRRDIQEVFSAPPLAYIPVIELDGRAGGFTRHVWRLVVIAAIFVVGVAAIHFTIMPIDVFWYTLLRKIGV